MSLMFHVGRTEMCQMLSRLIDVDDDALSQTVSG